MTELHETVKPLQVAPSANTTCKLQRAACKLQRATCNVQDAACKVQRAACKMPIGIGALESTKHLVNEVPDVLV